MRRCNFYGLKNSKVCGRRHKVAILCLELESSVLLTGFFSSDPEFLAMLGNSNVNDCV